MTLELDKKALGLRHIHYEAEMALLMARALQVFWAKYNNGDDLGWISDPAINLAVRGGLLEGLCIHTRNLIYFLGKPKVRDFNSIDYEFKSIGCDTVFLDRLCQRVSHLSQKRLDLTGDWHFNEDFNPVFKKIAEFFLFLLKERKDLFKLLDKKKGVPGMKDFEALKAALADDDPLAIDYKPWHEGIQTIKF